MSNEICLVVTGASGFLGKAIVASAAQDPRLSQVIAVHRKESGERLQKCEQLFGTNLSTSAGQDSLRKAIGKSRPAKISLIHCAGHFPRLAALHATGETELRRTIDDNLVSLIGTARALVPAMRRQCWGRIVAFSSHARSEHYPYMGLFNLAKAALESAIQTLANENARFGISANALMIATLSTEFERSLKPQGSFSDWLDPASVAQFALDIACSDNALLNGTLLHYWKHSDSFFGQSAFERNSIDRCTIDPDENGGA